MRSWAPVVAALLGAIPVVVHLARTLGRFDGLYGQDAYAYFDYAVGPLLESLRRGASPPPFHWPPGYPLAVALASLATGPSPLAGQLASALAGALVPIFTYLLVHEIWPADEPGASAGRVALLAGLVTGFSPQLGQSSVVVMADTTALAAATAGAWALARYLRQPAGDAGSRSLPWLMLASAALAYAVYTRWASALIVLPVLAYGATALAAGTRPRPRTLALHAAAAAAVALVVLSPVLEPTLASLAGRGSADRHTVDLEVVLTTWNPVNALRSEFVNSDGRQHYETSNLVFYLLAPARHALLTPIFALALSVGLVRLLRSRRRNAIVLGIGWPAVVVTFVVGISWQNFRYMLMVLPPLAFWAALGIDGAWRLAARPGRATIATLTAAGFVWMAIANDRLTERFVARKNATLELISWTEARAPTDAVLVTFSSTAAFRHYGHLDARELYALDVRAVDGLLAAGRPLRLLIDRANVERQWGSLSPGRNLRRFQESGCLAELDRRPPYTLYAVTPRPPGGSCSPGPPVGSDPATGTPRPDPSS